LISISYYQVAA